jgi:hypothetical protein
MGTNPVPEKQCVKFQYTVWIKVYKINDFHRHIAYHRQVPVELYYSFFLKPAGSPTVSYPRLHNIIRIIYIYIVVDG